MGRRLIPRLLERGHRVRAIAPAGIGREASLGLREGDRKRARRGVARQTGAPLRHLCAPGRRGPSLSLQGASVPRGRSRVVPFRGGRRASERDLALRLRERRAAGTGDEGLRASARGRGGASAGTRLPRHLPQTLLGPGHRWPYLLLPGYWLLERLPATRETALRIGLVTLEQMMTALVQAVENPPSGVRIVDVAGIRRVRHAPRA